MVTPTDGNKQEMGRAVRCFQVCTLAFLLLSAKASLPAAPKGALQVPFEYAAGRESILLHVRINDKPAVVIFDTGSAHTIVRPELVGVTPQELIPTQMGRGGGFMGDAIGREVSLEVGSSIWKKRRVAVMDLSLVLSVYEEKIDGILGLDFIKEFRQVTINVKEKTITFAY
ncbi:MAG TPA: retropepsin-like aspartic protease [Candidatus Angelobacter sp.]|nr:retropepsin-like aspartic protease [Candidatus Angelobacter sp.]